MEDKELYERLCKSMVPLCVGTKERHYLSGTIHYFLHTSYGDSVEVTSQEYDLFEALGGNVR